MVHRECRVGVPARNWRRRTGWRLRLGGGSEVVGIVYGEIKTSLGFCLSYYGDVVLVEARRLCYGGAGLNLEVEARRLCYVLCRLETGGGSSESCRVGVPASNSLVNT